MCIGGRDLARVAPHCVPRFYPRPGDSGYSVSLTEQRKEESRERTEESQGGHVTAWGGLMGRHVVHC